MARTTARALKRRPLATLLAGLVVVAGMWLAGGLAAAAGWPVWALWLAAALVWPIVPVALLILISPRLGLGRVAVALTLLGAGAFAVWWRPGLVAAVTTHARWIVDPTPTPTPVAPTQTTPHKPSEPVKSPPAPDQPTTVPIVPIVPIVPTVPIVPIAEAPVEPVARSRCFREVVKTQHSDSAYGTKLVDLDSDGILDLVAIDTADSPAIQVWRGDRGGRFHAASTLAYDGGGLQFAILDVDRDGKLDLATSDYKTASVTLWIGAGDGNFTRGASSATYRSPIGIWAADLDVDGFSDLVVAHYFHVEVLRGVKGGKLKPTPWLRLVKEPDAGVLLTPEDIALTDLTGDGLLDLVIPKGDVTSIEVWTGRGRGSFRRTVSTTSCYAPAHALVGDVIEDGSPDVAVRCGKARMELFAGDGKGGLESRGSIGPENAFDAGALVDLTGDRHLDLIVGINPRGVDFRGFDMDGGVLSVYAGDGKGGFNEEDALTLDGFQHRVVGVVDIDGDERLDVVYECFGQIPGGHLGVAFGTGCVASD